MGFVGSRSGEAVEEEEEEEETLLLSLHDEKIPSDSFHTTYIAYFTLGAGFLLPWNVFITAVDYFTYMYPSAHVNRVFALLYMTISFFSLLLLICRRHKSSTVFVRTNVGLVLFTISLLAVPILDLFYLRERRALYFGYYVTVASVALAGVASALVQSGVVGSAGELPVRYMQATVAGAAASGLLVSIMRIVTKAIYPQDADGLRRSANLYFSISIIVMVICFICYNFAERLPVIQYHRDLKMQAIHEEEDEKGSLVGIAWDSDLWDIVGRVKWFGFGKFLIYFVTLTIFPGFITEDVHSPILKGWYPVFLVTLYNAFSLLGTSLPAIFLVRNAGFAVTASVSRFLFYPLFLGCLHGPMFLRTEFPVAVLTCLLGLTNGYFGSILMILAPKAVPLQHAETAGTVILLFSVLGLAFGSVAAWFWVI